MRQANPVLKVVLALLSLLLTALVWQRGLQESFDRPSVTPKISVHQQEIAILAEPSVPSFLKPILIGTDPQNVLKENLSELSLGEINDRDRLILAGLETDLELRRKALQTPADSETYSTLQQLLRKTLSGEVGTSSWRGDLSRIEDDPLLYRIICFALDDGNDECLDLNVSRNMAFRLSFTQFIPFSATILGIGLLLQQGWLLLRRKTVSWEPLIPLPLSLLEMTLLIAGGFVVLGEVVLPALIAPIAAALTSGLTPPLGDSLKVLIGYSSMTIPPLLILRQQLKTIGDFETPENGWIQWRFFPIFPALLNAFKGWLMVMPLVLLTSWLVTSFVGDQGGSNPLLELVLQSRDPLALGLLLLTTVILAPAFEELIFRGTLLPVLVTKLGRSSGVFVSALVFALAHLSVGELPPLLVLGIGLGVLRLSSGRLFPCVLMHSLWNGITFLNLILLGS